MSLAIKRIVGPTQLANAAATVYTTPAGTQTVMKYLSICNTTGAAVNFTMSIGNDAAATELFKSYSIAANFTFIVYLGQALAATETIQAFASAATSLTMTLTGTEQSIP